ncbi:hypothetical protein NA57DRAFT_78883 [Rhizodiscina lignyota]|uniref:RNase III domain-containing protein n=1 Tax=Rhizodiscina lignyota TaxID=1504668 RepID=A0A9P4I6M0_9PEZI|nr:hypothetical protein NA57DRAFT_78883 [Rhizodiscina lignyota]
MTMPVRNPLRSRDSEFKVNNDPRRLDQMYSTLLGDRGPHMQLSDEVKWLAVTHKSFDHGRRGFNDRLAFLGKRIVDLQLSLALLNAPKVPLPTETHDEYGRALYHHPALETLDNLTNFTKTEAVDKKRLARLAEQYGLPGVIRWKPKKADNLRGAGIDSVLAQTMYAIVGALALEKGGEVANKTVKERILRPLGL